MFEVFHYKTTHHIGSQRTGTIQSSEPNEVNVNIINLLPVDSHGTKDCALTLFYRSLFFPVVFSLLFLCLYSFFAAIDIVVVISCHSGAWCSMLFFAFFIVI